VRVDVGAVHPGAQVEHAAGLALGHDDVVQREGRSQPVGRIEPRFEQHPRFRKATAFERVVDALEHAVGSDVGEEPEAAAIDAEDRHRAGGCHPRRVQHRAVTAHGNEQVGAARKFALGYERHRQQSEIDLDAGDGPHVPAALEQVRCKRQHGLADPRIGCAAREGDGRIGHVAGLHRCMVF
jgi:hypothetical protein